MKIERLIKETFAVIGKEGSTSDGTEFIQNLWNEANGRFAEVASLAKCDDQGNLVGIWGAMSDFSRSFLPWEENFSKGLYLAGIECPMDAQPPEGWTKWVIPGFEYLRAECENQNIFPQVIDYMGKNGISLTGAVHDFTCPATGKNYMYFPIGRL